ncbi:MAG: hypothetical protein ACSHW4_17375 [Cellulophaga sp.]
MTKKSYRITKYNPKNRNEEGHYLDNSEWTAISDIGKVKYKNISYEEYEKVETAYVKSIKLILAEKKITNLKVDSFYLHSTSKDFENYKKDNRLKNLEIDFKKEIKTIKNGDVLDLNQIDKVIRLVLRETMQMDLISTGLKIEFGYDYYMYVECDPLENNTIEMIHKINMFVE